MGCGSSVSQVADISREGAFRPFRLLESNELESSAFQGKLFLFGETRTERKILECDMKSNSFRKIMKRTRIPYPKIHLDPIQSLYEQSQQIFHQGIYGFSQQPPFNNMLALFLQPNLIFTCGGRDYDNYNIKSQAFFYSIVDDPFKLNSEMIHSSELSERQRFQPKFAKNKFEKIASMHKKRYSHTGLYCSKLKSILVFGGINEKKETLDSCEMYNIFENSWKQMPPMKKPRANAHCFQYEDRIFVFGGRSSTNKLSKKIEVFLLDTHEWTIMQFKLHRGIEEALVYSQNPNEILIVGGKTHEGCNRSVLRVDLKRQTYIWDSELNNEYRSIKGVTCGHEILVFGGEKDISQVCLQRKWKKTIFEHRQQIDLQELQSFSCTKQSLFVKTGNIQQIEVESGEEEVFFGNDIYPCIVFYDKLTGKLRKAPVPLSIRLKSFMGVIQVQEGMYMLLGGSDQSQTRCSRSCFFYKKAKNTGSLALKMSQKRAEFACVAYGNFVYVFGGSDASTGSALKHCERYDLRLQRWEEIKSMSHARINPRAEIIGTDKIVIIGGINQHFLGDLEIFYLNNDEYQIFRPRWEISGQIMLSYTKSEEDCVFVLAKNEDNQYYQCMIDLNAEQKEVVPSQQLATIVENSEKVIKLEAPVVGPTENDHIEVRPLHSNGQQHQQSEQSRDLHKGPVPPTSLQIKMIEVKSKKRYIDQKTSILEEQEYEEEFQMEKVNFQDSIVQEIRKSGKYLIEQLIRQKEKIKMEEEESIREEYQVDNLVIEGEVSKLSQKRQKYRKQSVDNQFKREQKEESQYSLRPQDSGRRVEWLKDKCRIIKRNNQGYCFKQVTLTVFEFNTDQHQEQSLADSHQLKIESLS